jgi:hypothetical protein
VSDGELRTAVKRANDRKEAAGLGQAAGKPEAEVEATARRLFVGLDIDLEELLEVATEQRMRAFTTVFATGMGPGMIGAAMWLEGLLAALLLMDARNLDIDGGGGGGTLKPFPPAAGAGGG